jgi:hypothetical protein
MTRHGISAGLLLLLLVPTVEADQVFTFTQLSGTTSGTGPVLSSVVVDASASNLGFTLNFAGPIVPYPQSPTDSVTGFLNLDTTLTASVAELLTLPSNNPANIGYYVDLEPVTNSNLGPGYFVDLVQTSSDDTTAELPITFASNSFSFSLPLSDLGNSNGQVNFGVIVGAASLPPNELVGSTAVVPEPGSVVALSSLMLAACAILMVRCKRA